MLPCAKKAKIEWLQKGALAKKEEVHYVLLPFGIRIQRVNVIATAIEKQASEDGSFCSIILDDGTDTIPAKFFGESLPLSDNIQIGDILVVIGEIREIEGDRSIIPDIVRAVENPNFELLRELELRDIEKEYWEKKRVLDELRKSAPEDRLPEEARKAGIPSEMVSALLEYDSVSKEEAGAVEEKLVDLREGVMQKITDLDSGEGAPYELVVSSMQGHGSEEVERALGELLNSGEIYEPKPGIYRRL